MATRLIIKREGSLLSVIRDQELTDTQLMAIEKILDDDFIAAVVAHPAPPPNVLLPLVGIEQYQAESR